MMDHWKLTQMINLARALRNEGRGDADIRLGMQTILRVCSELEAQYVCTCHVCRPPRDAGALVDSVHGAPI